MYNIYKNYTESDLDEFFGNPALVEGHLVAVGGNFSPELLFYAYTHGIFPWTENPIQWFSPDPRAIFDLDGLYQSKSLKKKIRRNSYKITFNQAFLEVMKGCSIRKDEETWITKGFFDGYQIFHELGFAHSIEAWDMDNNLVGGVYGVAIGKLFAGESMFSVQPDAGKSALSYLFHALKKDGFFLFDTQFLNEFTWSIGAYEIPRIEYLFRLKEAIKIPYKWIPDQIS